MIVEQKLLDFTCGDIVQMSSDPSRNRSRGNKESAEAHERIVNTKAEMYGRIMGLAHARGSYGITVHEVAGAFGKTPNEVSGRLSELRHILKWLKTTGERRNHAAVLVEK